MIQLYERTTEFIFTNHDNIVFFVSLRTGSYKGHISRGSYVLTS